MSWETEIAKQFKQRDNKKLIGVCIGTVTSVTPLKASILDGQIMLDSSNSYVCNLFLNHSLVIGDLILVVPSADEQKFFIIDIVKGVK